MATSPTVEAPTSESLSHFFLERVHEADTFFDRGEFLLRFDHLNYRDKVSLVYERLLFNHLLPEFAKDLKDDDAALRHKLNGDYHFQRGNVQRALENYTNCVATAESRGVSALAHADRSACLHKLGMRKQCLEEIERALVNGYPEESTQELIDRCEEPNQLPGHEGSYYEKIPEVPESQKNPVIPCASDCVRIENEEHGGYVVATRDIEIGEVISVERPYCSVVFPNDRLNYCHHCLKLCYNMIPCKYCTQALFCSEKCKEKARKLYHDYECPILLTLSSLTMKNPMVMVALRTTFLAVCDCFLLPRSEDDDCPYYLSERNYLAYFLKPTSQPLVLDLLQETVLAAFVYHLVWTRTNFFNKVISSVSCLINDLHNKFEEVFLLQLLAAKLNAVKIYDYVDSCALSETDNFAFGIYPFFSLFTHSCCANIMKSYHGNTMVLRALNTIKQGQQCFVNRYSLRYDAYPRAERARMLVAGGLSPCQCTACRKDWTPCSGDLPWICNGLGIEPTDFRDVVKEVIGVNIEAAKAHLPRLISLLQQCERSEPSGSALTLKKLIAHCYVIFGNKRLL